MPWTSVTWIRVRAEASAAANAARADGVAPGIGGSFDAS